MKVYGIKNCDAVKKARAWLDTHGIAYEFVDFKKTPPSVAEISRWCDAVGAEKVLNRRGTTWKKFSAIEQTEAETVDGAIALMAAHSSAIKRPVIEVGPRIVVGFDEAKFLSTFL